MKISKVLATTACSLLMSGAAFAEIVPEPVDNLVPGLSVVSKKISAADNDCEKASAIFNSFYDNFIGKAVMSEQTPVYVEWNFGEDKKSLALTQEKSNLSIKTRNSIVPPLDGNKSDSRDLFEESLQGITKDVHNMNNTVSNAIIGATAGYATGGPVGAVVGGVSGAYLGSEQDKKETRDQIARDEEKYQNGTNAWNAAKRDQLRRRKEKE